MSGKYRCLLWSMYLSLLPTVSTRRRHGQADGTSLLCGQSHWRQGNWSGQFQISQVSTRDMWTVDASICGHRSARNLEISIPYWCSSRNSQMWTDANPHFKKAQFWTCLNYVRNLVISLHDIALNHADRTIEIVIKFLESRRTIFSAHTNVIKITIQKMADT